MTERSTLIARKESVRARLNQLRRELERERLQPRPRANRMHTIESEIDRFMAEEQSLRQEIDRTA